MSIGTALTPTHRRCPGLHSTVPGQRVPYPNRAGPGVGNTSGLIAPNCTTPSTIGQNRNTDSIHPCNSTTSSMPFNWGFATYWMLSSPAGSRPMLSVGVTSIPLHRAAYGFLGSGTSLDDFDFGAPVQRASFLCVVCSYGPRHSVSDGLQATALDAKRFQKLGDR